MSRAGIRTLIVFLVTTSAIVMGRSVAAEPGVVDLRRAVSADAYLAVYWKHNPERDYQRKYFKEVYNTVQETRIIEQVLKILTSYIPEDELEEARAVFEELKTAIQPIDMGALFDCKEAVYAQSMESYSAQHLVLVRMTPDAAAGSEQGIVNLFDVIEKRSRGELPIQASEEDSIRLTTLALPEEAPFHPTVARTGDVFLFSTSRQMARESLQMLSGKGGQSKFDDPRLQQALRHLPEPEDALVFYDGRQQFRQLREVLDRVLEMSGGSPEARRWIDLVNVLSDELGVMDYEVTVEYTEGNHNRAAVLGKLLPGSEDKLLAKVAFSQQAFDDWQRWVPADATAYALSSGVNLHPLYERVVSLIKERIPEAQRGLRRFEELQQQHDVHLDRDILQAFSGETVSVTLPAQQPTMFGGQDSVLAMRCSKPEPVRELLHRLVEQLRKNPLVAAQQLQLVEAEQLDGFEEISATPLAIFGVRPVIGFRDGWMICGSNAPAVGKVLDTRAGQGQTIADTDRFKKFQLEIEGPVRAISYTNLADRTGRIATMLGQVGAVVPATLGIVGAQHDLKQLKPVQQLLGLLPSVAKIVSKFDFWEAKLSVTQQREDPHSYLRRSVTLVRPGTPDP